MPFAFLIVGLFLIVVGARNQQANAVTLLKSEFTGPNSFVEWLIAGLIIGGLGYIRPVKPLSDAFLFLMILVMIIANSNSGGLFAQFEAALKNTQPTPSPNPTTSNVTVEGATTSMGQAAPSTGSGLFGSTLNSQPLFGASSSAMSGLFGAGSAPAGSSIFPGLYATPSGNAFSLPDSLFGSSADQDWDT